MKFWTNLRAQLLCNWNKHQQQHAFVRNIYGDECNFTSARSVWKCSCGAFIYKPHLYRGPEAAIRDPIYLVMNFAHDVAMMLLREMNYDFNNLKNFENPPACHLSTKC